MPVKIVYFPLRGRVEVVKLILAYKGEAWECENVDYAAMKADRASYPFGQCPRFIDGDVDVVQSGAFIRHLARKFDMYGSGEAEMCKVDMLIEAVEGFRLKYLTLIYQDQLADDKKKAYWSLHGDKSTLSGRNGGVHLAYFADLLTASGGAFFVGGAPTAADFCVWEILDLHLRIFKEEIAEVYPELVSWHAKVAALAGVEEYLAGPLRCETINGNKLG